MNTLTHTFRPYPNDALLHALFEKQAAKTPLQPAVIFGNDALSYDELNRRSNQLARFLRTLPADSNGLIGICMERSLEMVIGLLGILKAGAAYVPIDPDYPAKRIDYMLKNSGVTILLTQSHLSIVNCEVLIDSEESTIGSQQRTTDDGQLTSILLDRDWQKIAKFDDQNPKIKLSPDDLAYVIYTSGSTGAPKGAMNTHRGICNRLLWMQDEYQLTGNDTVLQKTPFSFDVSVWEFFWPLISGAKMALAKPGGHRDSAYLAKLIVAQNVTVMHFVPAMLQLFLEEPAAEKCHSLRDVICSGEALTPGLRDRFFSVFKKANLHNLYGPTEAAIDVTFWKCQRNSQGPIVPIGRPVANTQIYILDAQMQPVPVGETGEIYIGGVQVGCGYWNQPELTAERFVEPPGWLCDLKQELRGGRGEAGASPREAASRLYRTGDLGRQLTDEPGVIEFIGRIDHQVKIRGFRIELGEIEATLESHSGVKQAVAVVQNDLQNQQRLVAYLACSQVNAPTVSALREFLAGQLPEYMIPATFVFLESLPLLANGKIDRKSLPEPGNERPQLSQAFSAPRTPLENYLAKIWRETLRLTRVGIHDRFFELGGTSLQAGQIIVKLQEALGESIFVVTFFDAPTIAEYARFLEKNYAAGVARVLREGLETKRSFSEKGLQWGASQRDVRDGVDALQGGEHGKSRVTDGGKPGNEKIDAEDVAKMQQCIPRLSAVKRAGRKGKPNPPAMFILAPPRSGTSLLRVMLAGHPNLFAAAELQLLNFNTLQERQAAFSGKFRVWLEGAIRAIMEIKQCDAEAAWQIMADFEAKKLTTKALYGQFQKWLGKRTLVEKSPQYALDPAVLQKAERDFEQPRYIHLVRHPYAMITSFEKHHMDQVLFTKPHDFSPRQLGELVWLISHQNIASFLADVPENRQYFLRYEDLVSDPETHIRAMCERLALDFHSDLLKPYKNLEQKMVDGIYAESRPMGDERLLEQRGINPKLADRWKGVLDDNFLSDLTWNLAGQLGYKFPTESPTPSHRSDALHASQTHPPKPSGDIAIIGMAGRFPGAKNVDELWENLRNGVGAIRRYSAEELRAAGVDPSVLNDPGYVPFGASLDEPESFDAAFFGYHAREAELMDPQQRIFLECAYAALENSGYNPQHFPGKIGVFGGVGRNAYLLDNVTTHPQFKDAAGDYQLILGSDKDYSVTRVAYKLNLRGPAFNVQTACSTSAVAIHLACQSIRGGDSDMAIAGGCRVMIPPKSGYFFVEGGPHSPDGCLRAFDANANGMVRTSGAAFVVLKSLDAALRDGDAIHAVIKSSAINNDGSAKIGFTAPSVQGQVDVITTALERAGIDPQTIGFVEAHGTGTILGDPIEVAGLTQAYRQFTPEKNYCALGSLKTNIGHLDAGAGVAGVIKAALALKHRQIPATLNFEQPNPQIDFANSPFFVNRELRDWAKPANHPRRAAVNSLGLGGTNAHIILEEAPEQQPSSDSRDYQLLLLSTKSDSGAPAQQAAANLADHLEAHPKINLADAAYTLQTGRQYFPHRRALVCKNRADAIALLRGEMPHRSIRQTCESAAHSTVFMFAGGGAQYLNMGRELYHGEPLFRQAVDECAELLNPLIETDIRELIYPTKITEVAAKNFEQPSLALPALFAIQFAAANLWMSWGIRPAAMIGHSMGEYTAACLSGVFSLKDALAMVVKRGELFETLPEGSMLSVPLSESQLREIMDEQLSIAAINKPDLCVASGPTPAIEKLQAKLTAREIESTRIRINVAAHSQMVEPILAEFGEFLKTIKFHPPEIPLISNVSGDWASDTEIANWEYWVKHLRQTVRFADGLGVLLAESERIFLEVGPGQTLAGLARQHPQKSTARAILSSLRHPKETTPDVQFLLTSLGRLWLAGAEIDWAAFYADERRYRVPLPTYPFERKRYWIDPAKKPAATQQSAFANGENEISQLNITNEGVRLSEQTPTPVAGKPRKERIGAVLQEILEDLSGMPAANLDIHTTFLELGFDSLFLTQANNAFQRKFKVKISFRQLFEEAPTIDALAAFIDGKLPEEAFPDESPAPVSQNQPSSSLPKVPSLPLANAAPGAESLIERVINQQLQLMAQQLSALQGGAIDPAKLTEMNRTAASSQPQKTGTPGRDFRAAEQDDDAAEGKSFGPWRPLEKRSAEAISESQRENLQKFLERYTAKTAGSKAIAAAQRPHYADPQSVNGFNRLWKEAIYPIAAARSAGARIVDVDGNEYVDLIMGFGVNLFGHSPDFVRAAVQQQLAEGWHLGVLSPLAKDVAKLVCEMTGFERVNIVNTGTEAVLAAVRAARTVTGKEKIAMFEGDYHGLVDEFLVRGVPTGRDGEYRSLPVAPGIPRFLVENTIVLKYEESCLEVIRANADELAAVLIEPVSARDPGFQPKEMIQAIRKVTTELEIPLIFDELITGFRLHPRGAQAWYGVEADICSYGKALSGGLPIGVVAGKAEYIDAFDGGMWQFGDDSYPEKGVTYFIGTFVRNPLSLAAANAALQRLKAESPALQKDLNEKTTAFAARVNALFERKGAPVKLVHGGSIIKFVFTETHPFNSLFFIALRDKGVLVRERACYMSTAHRPEDLEFVLAAIESVVTEMQTGGFLPVISPPDKIAATAKEASAKSDDFVRALPLTAAQMEIWLATGMGDDASCAFNISTSVNLRGRMDEAALRDAIQQLIDRHEALRTTFDALGEFQHIAPQMRIDVPLRDLSGQSEAAQQTQLREMLIEESRSPFDLLKGPLFRAFLVKLSGEQHVLVMSGHHLICDGWSLGVLINELGQIYAALSRGQIAQLPEPLPFSEYARQKSAHRQSAAGAEDADFWLTQFAESAPVLDLPADHPRPPVKTYRSGQQFLEIDRDTFLAFKKAAMKQGATAFAALMAVFSTLLQRLSGQDDFAIGLAAAGQSTVENGRLVGHCVNLLPLRAKINPQQTFGQFLKQMKGQLFDAFDHSEFTFGDLLEKLELPRDPSRTPLISAILTYETDLETLHFGDLSAETALNPKSYCNFDLELYLTERPQGLTVRLDHNADLFDAATVQRWLGYFQTLLESAGKDADQAIAALPLIPEAELRQILFDWNATEMDFPRAACIHQLFEAQAAKTPEATALIFGESEISYRELNARGNRLANYLQKRGVGRENLVGVCLERSPEMITAILAILKSGGAYLPIDPEYPEARISFMLEDSGAKILITQAEALSKWSMDIGQLTTICLDRAAETIAAESEGNLTGDVAADNLAYVIYTSGSTGRPKGVAIEHRNTCALLHWAKTVFDAADLQGVLAVTSICFDLSVFEIFTPLSWGGTVILGEDALAFADLPAKNRVRLINTVPSAVSELLRLNAIPDSVRTVNLAGEPLKSALVDELYEAGVTRVFDLYGPSEDTTYSTFALREKNGVETIGKPIANTRAYILDKNMQPVPIGVPGELYLAGDGVARGYLHRPELTAERFFAAPNYLKQELWRKPPLAWRGDASRFTFHASRLYQTGDLARWLADGNIEFLGRIDHQIKLRGFRIELGEIEAALNELPAVETAVVVVRELNPGDKRLIAYAAVGDRATFKTRQARKLLRSKLPEYMIPSIFVPLPELPLTPNGKIDRNALPLPDGWGTPPESRFEPPQTETEQIIAGIWQALIGVEKVGVRDNFFDIGGHSLLAMRMIVQIEKEIGCRISPREVIVQTLGQIAALCEQRRSAQPESPGQSDENSLIDRVKPGFNGS